ncbi:hypothetical protein ACFPRL_24260 [Pseudoclavibacter helvolus]
MFPTSRGSPTLETQAAFSVSRGLALAAQEADELRVGRREAEAEDAPHDGDSDGDRDAGAQRRIHRHEPQAEADERDGRPAHHRGQVGAEHIQSAEAHDADGDGLLHDHKHGHHNKLPDGDSHDAAEVRPGDEDTDEDKKLRS